MEKRLWPNTGIPLTALQWVGSMFQLTIEELQRIEATAAMPDKYFTPSHHPSLAPLGRDEHDPLATADV